LRRLALLAPLPALALLGCGTVPNAQLAVRPNPVSVGQTVTLDGSGTTNLIENPTFEFDVNGDGTPDQRGPEMTARTTYSQPGPVTVALIVTQGAGYSTAQNAATNVVNVTDPHLPTASYTVSPDPACKTSTVRFDGSASRDPDGSIVDYRWDLDGDGSFETDTGTNPVATHSNYSAQPAQRETRLRVTDNDGHVTEVTRSLVLWDVAACQSAPAAAVSPAAVEHKARFALTLEAPPRSTRGVHLIHGNRLFITNSRTGGSVRLKGLPTPLQHLRRARWLANLSTILDFRTQRLRFDGQALLRLGRKGNLCTALVITRAKGRKPTGTMKVLGGSGPARHIDGQAAYTGTAGLRGPLKVRGHIEMERKARGHGLTAACKALLRKR
jgi:hypothetical protein